MSFENVNPGDQWRPEPAARYNAVNDLLNAVPSPSENRQTRLADRRGALVVLAAASGAVIEQYQPVYLGSGATVKNSLDRADVVFPLADSGGVWGIAQQAASGGTVDVCLQGLTPAKVSGGGIVPGTRLAPASGGFLVSADAGEARAFEAHNNASDGVILVQLAAGGGAAGGYEYNSYFKLTLSTGDTPAITIADGATGSNSIAVVNGYTTYSIAPYTDPARTGRNALYFLMYTPVQYDSSGQPTSSGATLVISSLYATGSSPSLPSGGTSGAYYYQLGRLLWSNGAAQVVQDHTAGVAEFRWYVKCTL